MIPRSSLLGPSEAEDIVTYDELTPEQQREYDRKFARGD
jgi:hypothetical protein